jgi:hypothetical protein
LVTLAFAGVAIAVRRVKTESRWVRYAMVGAFLLFAVLKGSTPGGPGARADFDAARFATSPAPGDDHLLLS